MGGDQTKPQLTGLLGQLQTLGSARDGMLVALAVVYILGFLSWSMYAWQNNIGFIRILDAQYLIGGMLPALAIIVFYGTWQLAGGEHGPATFFVVMGATILIVIGFAVAWFTGYWRPQQSVLDVIGFSQLPGGARSGSAEAEIVSAIVVYAVLLTFLAACTTFVRIATMQRFWSGLLFFGACGIVYIAIMAKLYFFFVYPNLPQELGGARPRCAELVLDAAKLSKPVLQRLSLPVEEGETMVVADARVLYSGEHELIFSRTIEGKRGPSIEVRKEAVNAILWCN